MDANEFMGNVTAVPEQSVHPDAIGYESPESGDINDARPSGTRPRVLNNPTGARVGMRGGFWRYEAGAGDAREHSRENGV